MVFLEIFWISQKNCMMLEKVAVKHQNWRVSPRETKKTTDKSRDKTIRSKQKIARAKRIITASSVDKRLWKRSKGGPESSSGQPSQRRIHFVRRGFDAKLKKARRHIWENLISRERLAELFFSIVIFLGDIIFDSFFKASLSTSHF